MTGASTVDGYGRLRSDGGALMAAGRGCDAVCACSARASRTSPPTTCSAATWRCSTPTPPAASEPGPALAFRLKLALAAGFTPELASCARCGEADHLSAFSGAAGGVVCSSCEGDGFPFTEQAHRFMVEALAKPLAEAPPASDPVAALWTAR